ncbi:MAG: site-2 protease family protein [Sphingomonas sp.]|nr:site-2 protease family protein [Sphingomonas sp.]
MKGTAVKIHWTFLLFLAWIVLAANAAGGAAAALSAGLFFVLLFASVLLHEFGHIFVARRFGVRTPSVVLLPIGGVAQMERIPEEPRQELAIALAGPAVNLVIGGALVLALGGLPPHPAMDLGNLGQAFWTHLAFANLALALFNLLPAFPMDGGRALRAVLSARLGYARGTRAAAATGQVLAVLFGLFGIASGNVILTLIALFVFFAAGAEAGTARLRTASLGALASDLMITRFETLRADEPVERAARALLETHQREFLIVDALGRLQGVLTRDQIAAAVRNGSSSAAIGTVMGREVPIVSPLYLADHVVQLLQAGAPAVAVIDEGDLIGMITLDNVLEFILLADSRRAHMSQPVSAVPMSRATRATAPRG